MRSEGIAVLVSKNSGGAAGATKLAAARALRLPVIMVERPAAPEHPVFTELDAVLRWIAAHDAAP